MRLHRFYIDSKTELKHNFWIHNPELVHQWLKVLRYRPGQEIVLFDGIQVERLYRIIELKDNEAQLELITDFERRTPIRNTYLLWSLLKKDKNDWVLQKCTELGICHFVPIISERTEKMGFDTNRAQKIIIEAAEQCGRSDIPSVREPISIQTAFNELNEKVFLYVSENENGTEVNNLSQNTGIFIGPEGGWSDEEKKYFDDNKISRLGLSSFTLRAETAAIVAAAKLLQ